MKINVKVGDIFARVEVGDVDKQTREDIARHMSVCPECQRMIFRRRK